MKRKASHTITGLLATAAIGTSVLIPVQSAWAAANFADINKAGSYQVAVKTLAEQHVFEGYGADLLKPQQAITRAELAKLAVAAFGLPTGQEAQLSPM